MGHCGPIITTFNGPFQCSLYGPFNFCMGHLHRITKLYVSNGPWPLPFPITVFTMRNLLEKLSLCYKRRCRVFQPFPAWFRKNMANIGFFNDVSFVLKQKLKMENQHLLVQMMCTHVRFASVQLRLYNRIICEQQVCTFRIVCF